MDNMDAEFMKAALCAAQFFLEKDELPVGAVIVSEGKIIGRSDEEPFQSPYFNHAEMIALNQALRVWENDDERGGSVLYATLEPCVMCFGTILHCRVGRIVYALEDPYGGATCLSTSVMPPRHQKKFPHITSGVLREESRLLLKSFFSTTKDEYWKNNYQNPLFQMCVR